MTCDYCLDLHYLMQYEFKTNKVSQAILFQLLFKPQMS